MKKLMNIGIVLCLSFVLFSCTKTAQPAADSGKQDQLYKVVMAMITVENLPDLPKVQAAINERIKGRNLEVEFLPLGYATLTSQTNLMISGGEKLDLMPVLVGISNDVAQGKLLPLDAYLKTSGAGAAAAIGSDYLKAGTVNGQVYGLPSLRDMAASYGICMRKDILDKYGFKIEDIKTVDDLSRVYTKVSAGEPNMYMIFGPNNTAGIVHFLLNDWDPLGDNHGVLMNHGQDSPLKVVNLVATKEYENKLRIVRDWYQKGWVIPDAATNTESAVRLVGAGQLFSFTSNLKPGFDKQATLGAGGVEMVTATIMPAFSTTSQVGILNWVVPITCANPEKTMEFLNLLYTDPMIINLIDWGIEGTHYTKINDRVITYAPGVNATNTGYNMNQSWQFGNSLLAYVWDGNPADTNEQMEAFNKSAIISKALGFQFNTAPVKNAAAAVLNVSNQYRLSLEFGMVDVDATLPQFIRALEDAGINQIITEKQRQLDAWLAGK
ncbi:MAG: ABC transporter substrate-binding protein [Treponema sp.]|nr:ABC transporter substrate-binding protein [Treponema sp.]